MKTHGKRNSYRCNGCGGIVITLDIHEGVTPFMLPCLALPGCEGKMESAFYKNVPPIRPHYHWRKPTPEEYTSMGAAMKHHVDQGGLEIFPNNPLALPKGKP